MNDSVYTHALPARNAFILKINPETGKDQLIYWTAGTASKGFRFLHPADQDRLSVILSISDLDTIFGQPLDITNNINALYFMQLSHDLINAITDLKWEDQLFVLRPNPVRAGQPIFIEAGDDGLDFMLVDAQGRVIQRLQDKMQHIEIETFGLQPGIYFLLGKSKQAYKCLVVHVY